MNAGPSREPREPDAGRRLRSRAWIAVTGGLALYALLLTPIGRYLEFDEAVFYSQSGGHEGSVAPPNGVVASREVGTWALIGILRFVGFELPWVRLAEAALAIGVLLLGCWQTSRWTGRWSGPVGAVLFGTFWTTALFYGSFYGSLLGAAAMLLATGIYLQLREQPEGRLVTGALLGLAVAVGFYMRHVETLLVALVICGHAVLWRPRMFWPGRWRAVAVAFAVFTAAFVIPWSAWSTARYGSVWARIVSARGQGHPLSLHNGLGAWTRLLLGDSVAYDPLSPLPVWPSVVVAAGAVLLLGAVAAAIVLRLRARIGGTPLRTPPYQVLLMVLAGTSFGFFFFVSGIVRARYSLYGVAFASMVAGQLVAQAMPALRRRRLLLAAAAVALVVWIAAQATIARPYQVARTAVADSNYQLAHTMRVLARDEPCRLITQFGRTHFQTTSGCVTDDQVDADDVAETAEELTRTGQPVFVVWSASGGGDFAFDEDWHVVEVERPEGLGLLLYYHLPPGWDVAGFVRPPDSRSVGAPSHRGTTPGGDAS